MWVYFFFTLSQRAVTALRADSLRSSADVAMVNEALCKILCHNLVVLIHEMFELGIDPVFLPNGMIPAQRETA